MELAKASERSPLRDSIVQGSRRKPAGVTARHSLHAQHKACIEGCLGLVGSPWCRCPHPAASAIKCRGGRGMACIGGRCGCFCRPRQQQQLIIRPETLRLNGTEEEGSRGEAARERMGGLGREASAWVVHLCMGGAHVYVCVGGQEEERRGGGEGEGGILVAGKCAGR